MAKAWAEEEGTPGPEAEHGWCTAMLAMAVIELRLLEKHDHERAA
jgi:acyl dehydratase